jgi:hexosaminidase
MDPTGAAYPYIEGLLAEFPGSWGSQFVHFGGDEVITFLAWDSSDIIKQFKKKMNYSSNDEVRNYFQSELQRIAAKHSLAPIFWEEVYNAGYLLHNNSILNVWFGPNRTAEIVRAGYRVIHSYGWYLDQQHPPGEINRLWGDTWKNFYLNDPVAPGLNHKEIQLIMGGEASMWAEQVDDFSIETRIFPRASATAEALWTQAERKNITAAERRIEIHSCLMRRRGIRSFPLQPASHVINCILPANSALANDPALILTRDL